MAPGNSADNQHNDQQLKETDPRYLNLVVEKLRKPVTTIGLSLGILSEEVKEENLTVYIDIIKKNCGKINTLINEVLTLDGLIATGDEKYEIIPILELVLDIVASRLEANNILVTRQYGEQNPALPINCQKMAIAFTNIVVNAIEAVPPGMGEIKLVTKMSGGIYSVEIWDNGHGMNKETMEEIFQPFYTTKEHASGLGLAIADEILFNNNVHVKVDSREGIGTGFILLFEDTIKEIKGDIVDG